ncbi:MAG: hypothetical protein P8184_12460 [Calditrichia bacterium]
MTVGDIKKALKSYRDDEDLYVALLGHSKSAVFENVVVGEHSGSVQLSIFADTDTEGVTQVAVDLLSKDESFKSLLTRRGA